MVVSMALVAAGCSVEVLDGGGAEPRSREATATASEPVILHTTTRFDPPNCTQPATQCNGMHCCGPGEAMTGAHFNENVFQCSRLLYATDVGCFVDSTTFETSVEGVTVKACPFGTYMKGHHANQNKSTCCPFPIDNATTSWIVDGHGEPPLQASFPFLRSPWPFAGTCRPGTMHVCPADHVMEGVHVGQPFSLRQVTESNWSKSHGRANLGPYSGPANEGDSRESRR